MNKTEQPKDVGIIGTSTFALKLAMHFAAQGYKVSLVDDSINELQEGLQRIAGWVEKNGKDGLFSGETRGDLLRRIEIGCAVERLSSSKMVIMGSPLSSSPDENTGELFRLLEAVIPPDRPIMTRLATPELGEKIRSIFPNPSRVVPFVSFFESYLPHTWELRRFNHTVPQVMSICEETLHEVGFQSIQYSGERTTPLRRLFLKTLSECCTILTQGNCEVDELDYAFPLGAMGGLGCCFVADLIGLETVLKLNDQADEILDKEALVLLAKYLKSDRLGVQSGEGFYLHG